MASSVYSAYAQSAGEINNNLASFRNDIDNIKSVNQQIVAKNKQLLQGAYQKTDLDALRGIGEEVAVRTFKKYGGRALDYVDKRFLGGQVESDTNGFMNNMRSKASDLYDNVRGQADELGDSIQERANAFSGQDPDGDVEMNDIGGGSGGNQGGEGIEEDGTEMTDALDDVDRVDETDIGDMSFDDFMNQFDVPRTADGNIDFDRATQQAQTSIDESNAQLTQREGQSMEEPTNETGVEESKSAEPERESKEAEPEDDVEDATGEAEDAGVEGAEDALAGAGETAVDEGVGAGLEGAGTALDATGIGAVVGVPLQVAGALLEGGAIYEAGKGVVDWVEQLFGKKPDAPSVAQVAVPKPLPTLAQRGMMITPTMDTLDTQPSFAGGW